VSESQLMAAREVEGMWNWMWKWKWNWTGTWPWTGCGHERI